MKDCEQAAAEHRYERLIAQPVVFARLAGFLAAHMSLGEDPLRRVMEAMMLGYSEAEAMDREQPRTTRRRAGARDVLRRGQASSGIERDGRRRHDGVRPPTNPRADCS